MKPDGVATAALEPTETLGSNPVNEAPPPVDEDSNQVASPMEDVTGQQPAGEMSQGQPQPGPPKETPTAKTSTDPKAKAPSKTTAKPKAGTTGSAKTTAGSRPNNTQSRLTNGISKPQANGVAKKTTTGTLDKKNTPNPAASKKPLGTAGAVASKPSTKANEKKPVGAVRPSTAPATNGVKSTTVAKKTSAMPANGDKTSTTAAATKKPAAPRPASAPSTKPGSAAAAPKPPVTKTARPTTGTASRPGPVTTRPPAATTAKSSTAKPATPKAASTTPKPIVSKSTSTTPSTAKTPVSQASKTTTPIKKDATKPTTPAAKKPAPSPLSRPTPIPKSTKPETAKSASKPDSITKKPAASKSTDDKTPNRPKSQENKAPKTSASKSAATKTTSPKKSAGTTTPTPVKRAPKPTEPATKENMEIAASVVAATAIATAAAVIAKPEEPEPPAEVQPSMEAPAVEEMKLTSNQAEVEMAPVPEPALEQATEPTREPSILEPVQEQTPEPVREPTPEPIREPTPEPIREPTPEPIIEATPQQIREPSPEPFREPTPEPEPISIPQLSAQLDFIQHEGSTDDSVPSLGTTVMSPPCSPPSPMSPVREPENNSPLLDMHVQHDLLDHSQPLFPSAIAPKSLLNEEMKLQVEDDNEEEEDIEVEEEDEMVKQEEEKENLFLHTSKSPSTDAFDMKPQTDLLGTSPMDDFTCGALSSPQEKEEAVEKADQEINEDVDEEEEEEGDEDQRRLAHQSLSMFTDMSSSQPSDEFQFRSSGFSSSAGWHGDDMLSGIDSEDVSSSTSSQQRGVSDLSSTQHTALLEGTQSSDALIDSSFRGSEGDANFMGSPNMETLANEGDEDEDEDERVDDMDVSSERVEDHPKVFQQQERDGEEEEDVEMPSEGVTESGLESCGNADEDDFNEEENLDNFTCSGLQPTVPPASAWAQTNPFSDPWTQPSSLVCVSSPSPVSDHGLVDSETPTQSPAQAWLDSSAPSLGPESEEEPQEHQSAYKEMESSAPEEPPVHLAAPNVGMSQSSTLSGAALAAQSSSETSTPEELRDYDSSSGVESRSDKQQTPVPTSVQPDMEQDLGIHLEKGDGEEEEAETLPADEVLGAGPPTAPTSAPSSPSTSGDEASDTEGEMQINDPDAPMIMEDSAEFDGPTPTCSLPALEEDEEAVDTAAGEGEEDGGGATPQSANSVASYGFDCTTSNSNAHSMAESCGKSPGIFSLENEDQLPEEAKDPSLIKELTLPSAAAAHVDDLLDRPVDLMPLGHPGESQSSLDDHHYMLGVKMATGDLEEVDPLEPDHHHGVQHVEDANDSQPPYYSAVCDKTDNFMAGNV